MADESPRARGRPVLIQAYRVGASLLSVFVAGPVMAVCLTLQLQLTEPSVGVKSPLAELGALLLMSVFSFFLVAREYLILAPLAVVSALALDLLAARRPLARNLRTWVLAGALIGAIVGLLMCVNSNWPFHADTRSQLLLPVWIAQPLVYMIAGALAGASVAAVRQRLTWARLGG